MVFMSRKAFEEALLAERKKQEEEMWKRDREHRMEDHIYRLEQRISVLEVKLGIRDEDNCCEKTVRL